MKISFGERLRIARENKGFDQARMARKVEIAVRTLQRWEKGEQVPDSEYLMRIVKHAGVRPEWLLTGEGEMYPVSQRQRKIIPLHNEQLLRKVTLVDIPLFSSIPAGRATAIFHPDHVDRYVTVDNIRDRNAFALLVKGNSMSPRIEDGDIVVVSPQHDVRNGDICVVRVNDEDTLKKVNIEEQYIHLIPLNPAFEPLTVRKRDVTFLWKVVKVIKSL